MPRLLFAILTGLVALPALAGSPPGQGADGPPYVALRCSDEG